jgi:hypothetical protein
MWLFPLWLPVAGRQLVTLEEAGAYITELPKAISPVPKGKSSNSNENPPA